MVIIWSAYRYIYIYICEYLCVYLYKACVYMAMYKQQDPWDVGFFFVGPFLHLEIQAEMPVLARPRTIKPLKRPKAASRGAGASDNQHERICAQTQV